METIDPCASGAAVCDAPEMNEKIAPRMACRCVMTRLRLHIEKHAAGPRRLSNTKTTVCTVKNRT